MHTAKLRQIIFPPFIRTLNEAKFDVQFIKNTNIPPEVNINKSYAVLNIANEDHSLPYHSVFFVSLREHQLSLSLKPLEIMRDKILTARHFCLHDIQSPIILNGELNKDELVFVNKRLGSGPKASLYRY